MSSSKFRVAICGGGIAGLSSAIVLARYPDIQVDIYEAASKLFPVGAGIHFWPRSWEVLKMLGVDEDVARIGLPKPSDESVHAFTLRKGDQPVGLEFCKVISKGPLISCHRGELQEVLLSHVPDSCKIHFSKRLTCYTQRHSGKIDLLFQDGTSAPCDILIGADSIKSVVRSYLLREQAQRDISSGRLEDAQYLIQAIDPVWTGSMVYRSIISRERFEEMAPSLASRIMERPTTQYVGRKAHIIVYPISEGKQLYIGAYTEKPELYDTTFDGPWTGASDKKEMFSAIHFASWEPELQEILKCIDTISKWAVHITKELPYFASGQVALIGDAAHAMTPHQSSGAGQALEDAYLLATILGHPRTTMDTIPDALRLYDSIRRPFAQEVVRRSWQNARYFSFLDEKYADLSSNVGTPGEEKRLVEMGEAIVEGWKWAWTTSFKDLMDDAVEKLEASDD